MTATAIALRSMRDRWRPAAIAAVVLATMLVAGMSVYRGIDLSIYTDLPEVFRALTNLPADVDTAALAYGAIYSSYGALALASVSLVAGAAAIAGEERDGTLGLLLANPTTRSRVLVAKAASMIILTAAGTVVMWGGALAAPPLLDVDVGALHVSALMVHLFVNAVFYGTLALCIGAWTGRRGLASGAAASVMVVSFVVAGLFPLVPSLRGAAKVSPWYWFDGAHPLDDGVAVGYLALLVGTSVAMLALGLFGVNRRDLRSHDGGVTVLDRLRASPWTHTVVERLAGSTRVSRIWVKTASDHQVGVVVSSMLMFWMMGIAMGPLYAAMDERLASFTDQLPEAVMALVGGGDLSTAEGFYAVETFSMMAPIAVMAVTVAMGARALAGEEARRTMGLLLANPVSRRRVVVAKTGAMALHAATVGVAVFAGTIGGSLVSSLGMSATNVAAICVQVTLIGMVFGAMALALGAATGRVAVAVWGTTGTALVSYLANAFLPLAERSEGWAWWSPFHYYAEQDPLANGMPWSHAGVLAISAMTLVATAVVLFDRRDLGHG